MTHKHHCLGLGLHELFKPLYRLYVKMVGGLVEEQHVGTAQKDFGEFDAHSPSAGELAGGTVEVVSVESESGKSRFYLGVHVRRSGHIQAFVQESKTVNKTVIFLRFIVSGIGHLLRDLFYLVFYIDDIVECLAGLIYERRVVGEIHLLWQVSDSQVVRLSDRSGCRSFKTCQYFKQCRFTGSVLSRQRYLVSVVDHETDAGKEWSSRKFNTKVVY